MSALNPMTARDAFDTPSKAVAVEGEVVVIGPEGVAHAFTPEAARETGRRLTDAADEAEQQIDDPEGATSKTPAAD